MPERRRTEDRQAPDFEAPGSLPEQPLGSDAFGSPLHARPQQPERKSYRWGALAIVVSALLVSISGVAVALLLRTTHRADMPSIRRETQPAQPSAGRVHVTRRASVREPLVAAAHSTGSAAERVRGGSGLPPGSAVIEPAQVPDPRVREETRPRAMRGRAARTDGRADRRSRDGKPELPREPTRVQVIAAMKRVTPAVHACFGKTHGKVQVNITVLGATGRVTTAKVKGRSGRVGSCIARAVRQARLPKFAKRKLEIGYPFAR
jgi:hypothetical protein